GSKCDADAQAALPDDATTLSRRAVDHLETRRELGKLLQLQARASGGIVDEDAIEYRRFRPEEDLGGARDPALGFLACVQSGIRGLLHDRALSLSPFQRCHSRASSLLCRLSGRSSLTRRSINFERIELP